MTNNAYMQGRKKYQRPQAMLWADNPGTIDADGFRIPLGNEVNGDGGYDEAGNFLILSDHNREKLDFNKTRIEKRERMVNGRMRSYHIADKLEISTGWTMLPSRSYQNNPDFITSGSNIGKSTQLTKDTYVQVDSDNDPFTPTDRVFRKNQEYTVDGGAGGNDLLFWYENNPGSFWVYLAYDNYNNFSDESSPRTKLAQYNEVVEVFFSDFTYSVVKRNGSLYDFWDVSLKLEEV